MKNFLTELKKAEHINHNAIGQNFLLQWMYLFFYPFAILFARIGLSPNVLTTLSLTSATVAFICLIFHLDPILFTAFWFLTILFDFTDGTVARMTKNVRETAFRYDHNSDIIKISLMFIGAGAFYDDKIFWLISSSSLCIFLISMLINHDLGNARRMIGSAENINNPAAIKKSKQNRNLFKSLKTILLTVHGHSLLLFLVIPFGQTITSLAFLYLALISLRKGLLAARALYRLPKV